MKLDHFVHFTSRSVETIHQTLSKDGWNVRPGGKHSMWGTANALLHAGLSYVEWLTIEDPAVAQQSENPLIRQAVALQKQKIEGIYQLCFSINDPEGFIQHMKAKGFSPLRFPGSRHAASGEEIKWEMIFPGEGLPFFIYWHETDEERTKRLTDAGFLHENDRTAIRSVTVETADPEALIARWNYFLPEPFNGRTVQLNETIIEVVKEGNRDLHVKEVIFSGGEQQHSTLLDDTLYKSV